MFNKISWTNYWMFILMTSVVYYTAIVLLYYSNTIKRVFSGKSNLLIKLMSAKTFPRKNAIQAKDNCFNSEHYTHSSERDFQSLVNNCMHDIKSSLEYAANKNLVKQEIIYALQQTVKKYAAIKFTSFKSDITNYIFIECSNYCSIHLDEGDLTGIWASE